MISFDRCIKGKKRIREFGVTRAQQPYNEEREKIFSNHELPLSTRLSRRKIRAIVERYYLARARIRIMKTAAIKR
jgi:hypothetical protein